MIIFYTIIQTILILVTLGATLILIEMIRRRPTKNKFGYWIRIIIPLIIIVFCTSLIGYNYVMITQYQQMRIELTKKLLEETLITLKEINHSGPPPI